MHTHGTLCGAPLPAATTTHHALTYLRAALDHYRLPDLLDLPLHLPLAAAATNASRDPLHIQQAAMLLQVGAGCLSAVYCWAQGALVQPALRFVSGWGACREAVHTPQAAMLLQVGQRGI